MAVIHCICGRGHNLQAGQRTRCACDAIVRHDGTRPVVRIDEDSLQERKSAGKKVVIRRPWFR